VRHSSLVVVSRWDRQNADLQKSWPIWRSWWTDSGACPPERRA